MDALKEIGRIKREGRYRTLRTLGDAPASRVTLEGRSVLNFSSNNYLGLARDPRVLRAAAKALERWGLGATSSRLLAGTLSIHAELEKALSEFFGFESALVFPSGFQANAGWPRALAGPEDLIVFDRLSHASIVDGCRLSGARLRVFRHNDPGHLERVLRSSTARNRFVVTESVFSMDGDTAPLTELAQAARRHGAFLVVDEAHGLGVLGDGRGGARAAGVRPELLVGTLSKALGSQGGFLCAEETVIDLARNKARSFIYTTALSPACAAGALEALRITASEPFRGRRVLERAAALRSGFKGAGFDTLNSAAQIVPVLLGDEKTALTGAERLESLGIFAPAIRPPTVPEGECRLRFSVIFDHTPKDLDGAARALAASVPESARV